MRRFTLALFCGICCHTTVVTSASAASAGLQQDCQALTAAPHRLTGSPEGQKAVDHVIRRLAGMGIVPRLTEADGSAQKYVAETRLVELLVEAAGGPEAVATAAGIAAAPAHDEPTDADRLAMLTDCALFAAGGVEGLLTQMITELGGAEDLATRLKLDEDEVTAAVKAIADANGFLPVAERVAELDKDRPKLVAAVLEGLGGVNSAIERARWLPSAVSVDTPVQEFPEDLDEQAMAEQVAQQLLARLDSAAAMDRLINAANLVQTVVPADGDMAEVNALMASRDDAITALAQKAIAANGGLGAILKQLQGAGAAAARAPLPSARRFCWRLVEGITEAISARNGGGKLIVQPFPTTQTRVKRCELVRADGQPAVPLYPMRPNGIIPPVTPDKGITGPIIHGGAGSVQELSPLNLRDAIVVLDYNTGPDWLRALRLGAKAIIFVRNGEAGAEHPHHVDANANLPRFFFDGPAAGLPKDGQVTIHSDVVWESAVGRNVFAFLPGTDPVFSQEKDETIILASNIDSFGEVPTLSPGARVAANCAGLLKLTGHFKQNPPRRHLLITFFDCQARGHLGSSVFYRSLETEREDATVEERQKSQDAELKFLAQLKELLAGESPLAVESDVRRQLINRLADRATEQAYTINDRMYKLREEMIKKSADEALAERPEVKQRIAEIQRRLTDELQPEKDRWNDLRRGLGRERRSMGSGKLPTLGPEVHEKLARVLARVDEDIDLRVAELVIEGQSLRADAELKNLLVDQWISLHISLLLGDASPRWGLVIGGESALHSSQDNPGLYGKIQAVFLRAYRGFEADNGAASTFVVESADQSLSQTRVLWGAPHLVHSGEIAGLFGIYNLCVGTAQESLENEGTPDDTLERLDLDRIEAQVDEIGLMLSAVADLEAEEEKTVLRPVPTTTPEEAASAAAGTVEEGESDLDTPETYAVASQEGLSLRRGIVTGKEYVVPGFKDDSVKGPMVMGLLPGSSIPNTPMAGAILQFRLRRLAALSYNPRKPYAFDDFQVLRTTRNGTYGLGPVRGGWSWNVYGGFAAVFNERGEATSVSDLDSFKRIRWRLNVFRGKAAVVVLPPSVRTDKMSGEDVRVLSSRANAQLDQKKSFVETGDGIVSLYSEDREKGVKLFSLRQLVGLANGTEMRETGEEADNPQGIGFSMEREWETVLAASRSASDLWRLNESRLKILRSKGIQDSSLAELHGRSEDILELARGAESPLQREALATSSFLASQPVYRKVRTTLDDLVFAVLILLALSVPFAFAVERVVVGSTIVYRQISWFVAFFCATFLMLYLSHPAFAIANTPIIIFLGFAIVVMSVMVIFIIMRKFEVELKSLQGMTATVHSADVSRISTFMAAMHMGISTMRRRPLRTALTAITVILLTFTILCFASFETQSGIVTLLSGPNPAYTGVWVHNVNWSPISPDLTDTIEGRWTEQVDVCSRYWISPETQDKPGLLITTDKGDSPVTIRGVLGLEAREMASRPDMADLFPNDLTGQVLITEAMANALAVKQGDTILLAGQRLQVGPLLDAVRVSDAKDMDGSSILPADFTEASSAQQTQAEEQDEESLLVQRNWASLPVDSVAVVSADTARALGARLYGLMLYTRDTRSAVDIAEDLARMLPTPIAATRTNGVYRHVLGTVLAASGVKDLFFPILLGGLVIFGTMLGSVADREKEIYTFSALGLAPKHVATLFFAESMVYSLLGGMGGYLVAQATTKVLSVLADYGLVRVPEMNMSSTNTIVTILIVMLTVLVSAIYPAIKASRSANPGLLRIWRPPEPKDDVLDLVFPFTVSEYDITGVVSFLKEHFANHSDTGLGRFMTSEVNLVREDGGALGLDAFLALAPFDLGVSQSFALRSSPSEIPGIDEVRVVLGRRSGQPKDWQRLNKVFLDDLRQQFLIWRSIPHDTMELYREQTLTELGARETPDTAESEPATDGSEA